MPRWEGAPFSQPEVPWSPRHFPAASAAPEKNVFDRVTTSVSQQLLSQIGTPLPFPDHHITLDAVPRVLFSAVPPTYLAVILSALLLVAQLRRVFSPIHTIHYTSCFGVNGCCVCLVPPWWRPAGCQEDPSSGLRALTRQTPDPWSFSSLGKTSSTLPNYYASFLSRLLIIGPTTLHLRLSRFPPPCVLSLPCFLPTQQDSTLTFLSSCVQSTLTSPSQTSPVYP